MNQVPPTVARRIKELRGLVASECDDARRDGFKDLLRINMELAGGCVTREPYTYDRDPVKSETNNVSVKAPQYGDGKIKSWYDVPTARR